MDIPGVEREVVLSENPVEHLFARGKAVVVSQNAYIRHAEPVEYVALLLKLQFESEVGQVAGMHHKIKIFLSVERLYRLFRFVIPSLRVADDGKRDALPAFQLRFDALHVLCVDARFSVNVEVVGMVFDHVASSRRKRQAAAQKRRQDVSSAIVHK